jgi:hypothetical protein
MLKRSRMPRDPSKLGKAIIDIATGQAPPEPDPNQGKDPAAVALGRRGGLKGGKVRAAKMSAKDRSAAARRAAMGRWSKKPGS